MNAKDTKNTRIRISKDVHRAIKIRSMDEEKPVGILINDALREHFGPTKKSPSIDRRA